MTLPSWIIKKQLKPKHKNLENNKNPSTMKLPNS